MHEYLSKDKENVLVVHCKNGHGRTGVFVESFLMFEGYIDCAPDAVVYFNYKRREAEEKLQYHIS